jgi:CDP-diacylglycerol pyrophosphatase
MNIPRGSFRKALPGAAASLLLVLASPSLAGDPILPPAPPHANGQVLWHIVHDQCVPDEMSHNQPAPCAEVELSRGVDHGFAVLKDKHGREQYLLMPTQDITGIEDPKLLAPGAPNYFAAAWTARTLVEARLGHPLPRQDMGVSVNSIYGRSQDLLHLHIDCLTPATVAALGAAAPRLGVHWSRAPLILDGHPYLALVLAGEDLKADPFTLLARGVPGAAAHMGAWTLVLAGARGRGGAPIFILLASEADPLMGRFASGEELQDHDCAVAQVAAPRS